MPRTSVVASLASLASLLAVAAPAAAREDLGRAALGGLELAVHAGGAFAPSSGLSSGGASGGGLTMGGAVLWSWGDRFRFGAAGFAADFGSRIQRVEGLGGGDVPSPLGDIETEHRGAWGLGWRVDVLGPESRRWGRPFAGVTYQAGRFGSDRQGRSLETRAAMAASATAGWERTFGTHHAMALAAGPTLLTAESTEHFTSAHLEWRWRP